MCGRVRAAYSSAQLHKAAPLKLAHAPYSLPTKENASPGEFLPVIRSSGGDIQIAAMIWGLIPNWHNKQEKVDHFKAFNCRLESVLEKPSFSNAFSKGQTCVLVLSGYYEWKTEAKEKQPYYVKRRGDELILAAGIYDSYSDSTGKEIQSFTILTTSSRQRSAIFDLHDRTPIFLSSSRQVEQWLSSEAIDLVHFFRGEVGDCTPPDLCYFAVTSKINSGLYQEPDCSTPTAVTPTISTFFSNAKGIKGSNDAQSESRGHSSLNCVSGKPIFEVVDVKEEKEKSEFAVLCPMCGRDLVLFSETKRNLHAGSCDGKSDSSSGGGSQKRSTGPAEGARATKSIKVKEKQSKSKVGAGIPPITFFFQKSP